MTADRWLVAANNVVAALLGVFVVDAIDFALASEEMKTLRPLLGPRSASLFYRIAAELGALRGNARS